MIEITEVGKLCSGGKIHAADRCGNVCYPVCDCGHGVTLLPKSVQPGSYENITCMSCQKAILSQICIPLPLIEESSNIVHRTFYRNLGSEGVRRVRTVCNKSWSRSTYKAYVKANKLRPFYGTKNDITCPGCIGQRVLSQPKESLNVGQKIKCCVTLNQEELAEVLQLYYGLAPKETKIILDSCNLFANMVQQIGDQIAVQAKKI